MKEAGSHGCQLSRIKVFEFCPKFFGRSHENEVRVNVDGGIFVVQALRQEQPRCGAHSEHVPHVRPPFRIPNRLVLQRNSVPVGLRPVQSSVDKRIEKISCVSEEDEPETIKKTLLLILWKVDKIVSESRFFIKVEYKKNYCCGHRQSANQCHYCINLIKSETQCI